VFINGGLISLALFVRVTAGSCRMNIPDAIFPPHGTIFTAEKCFVQ